MLFISCSFLWSLTFFSVLFYVTLVFSVLMYTLPMLKSVVNKKNFKNESNQNFILAQDFYPIFLTFITIFFLVNYTWTSYSLTSWFGHLVFTSFQHNFFYLNLIFFTLCIAAYSSFFFCGTFEINDYYITCFNFNLWTIFLFTANTLFATIFFIEVLSTLIFLLVISSTFSSAYFYTNTTFTLNSYLTGLSTNSYFHSLMFFFWTSLLSSLSLFLLLIFFYSYFYTFDWNLTEYIFAYINTTFNAKTLFSIFLVWILFLFAIFLKCGLIPFYFWKPIFFKGLPFHALLFYIIYFYFFIFIFFTFLFLFYLNEVFYVFIFIFNLFLILGFLFIISLLAEAYYLKSFLAFSSILNTFFIFLTFSSLSPEFFFFIV